MMLNKVRVPVVQDVCLSREVMWPMLGTLSAGPLAVHLSLEVAKLGDASEVVSSCLVSERAAEPGLRAEMGEWPWALL